MYFQSNITCYQEGRQCSWQWISDTLSVVDQKKILLLIATYMLQFHNIANMTKQIPDRFPLKQKPKIKNTELSLTIGLGKGQILLLLWYKEEICQSNIRTFGRPEKVSRDNRAVPGEYTGPMGTLV